MGPDWLDGTVSFRELLGQKRVTKIRQGETLSHQGAITHEVCCSSAQLGIQSSCVRSPWQHSTAFMLLCCRIIGCKFPDFSLVKLLPITNDYEISSNHLLELGEPCITYVDSWPNHLDFYNGKNYLGHTYVLCVIGFGS